MATHNWMEKWLNTVSDQISWKNARPVLLRELEDHLEDQYEALRSCGETEGEAQQEALRQMGDPVCVGKALDRSHQPKQNRLYSAAVMVIALVGALLVSFGATASDGYTVGQGSHFLTQFISLVLGVGLFCGIQYLNPMKLQANAGKASVGLVLLMGLLFAVSYRSTNSGYLGQYSALLIPLCFSGMLYVWHSKGQSGFWLSLGVLLGLSVLCGAAGRNQTYVLLGLVVSAVLLVVAVRHGSFGRKKYYVPMVAGLFTVVLLLLAFLGRERLSVLLHPEEYAQSQGYMLLTIRDMLQASRWIGRGLPIEQTILGNYPDLSLVLTIYRWGWLAGLGSLLLEVALLTGCTILARKQNTLWGKLLSWAVVLPMVLQSVFFLASNLGVSVSYSCHLPLLAYGGTFRVMDLVFLGLLACLARNGSILRDGTADEKILDFAGNSWYKIITKRE